MERLRHKAVFRFINQKNPLNPAPAHAREATTMPRAVRNKVPRERFTQARSMRNSPTSAELHLWTHLRNRKTGFKFRRQSIIFGYIADFYCPKKKLIIEVDGGYHLTPAQQKRDKFRSSVLLGKGFTIVRVKNNDVFFDTSRIVESIKKAARSLPNQF